MLQWLRDAQPAVQAAAIAGAVALASALIAGVSTAFNVVVKDRLDERRSRRNHDQVARETYRKYADPLTASALALFWRLREILHIEGSYQVSLGAGESRFERYKTESTRYRIAALLGWMSALESELVLCDAQPDPSVGSMRIALARVRDALAEGGHIDVLRFSLLCALWDRQHDEESLTSAGRKVDLALKRRMVSLKSEAVTALSEGDQQAIVREIRSIVHDLTQPMVGTSIAPSMEEVIRVLSIKEAWLFRDWQRAIGEMMLVDTPDGARRFDVRGFRAYTTLASEPGSPDQQWIQRLRELTDDFDSSRDPQFDARIGQLKQVLTAIAQLIIDFQASEPSRTSIQSDALEAARRIVTPTPAKALSHTRLDRLLDRWILGDLRKSSEGLVDAGPG